MEQVYVKKLMQKYQFSFIFIGKRKKIGLGAIFLALIGGLKINMTIFFKWIAIFLMIQMI